jgi:UDP-3-O-[3-hydroxymyristoyl] glucosamine N-acyltransferase
VVDSAFYDLHGPIGLRDLARAAGASLLDEKADNPEISNVASFDAGGPGDVSFVGGARTNRAALSPRLTACFATQKDANTLASDAELANVHWLVCERPQEAFAHACAALASPKLADFGETGVHPRAELGEGVQLAPGARIAAGARIGDRTRVGPNAVIYGGVEVGPDSDIGPGATLMFCRIGARAMIRANAVIGEAGFGMTEGEGGLIDLPHLGRVLIGDEVTIGAGTTVDRGMLADTTIGDRTKIDNLVQVAHNVSIGSNCVLAGCCGISGSAVIEDGAMLGGSVGISDHVRVGAGARLAGATLVMRDVPAGEAWAGAPARPIKQFFRETVALEKLAQRKPKS